MFDHAGKKALALAEKADDNAKSALAEIRAHNAVCTERWGDIKLAVAGIQVAQNRFMYGLILIMVAVIGFGLSQWYTHSPH